MPGRMIEAECECGWTRVEDLRPGSSLSEDGGFKTWVMAYENGDIHTVDAKYAEAQKLEVLEDPFLNRNKSMQERVYRCPSCGRKNLKLLEVGNWD